MTYLSMDAEQALVLIGRYVDGHHVDAALLQYMEYIDLHIGLPRHTHADERVPAGHGH